MCPVASVKRSIGSGRNCRPLVVAWHKSTSFGWGTPYPSSNRNFRVRKTVTADSQNIRAIGWNCGRDHGQSADTNWSHTGDGHDLSASMFSPRPRSIRDRTHGHSHSALRSSLRPILNHKQSAHRPRTQFVRVHELAATMLIPCNGNVRNLSMSAAKPRPRIVRVQITVAFHPKIIRCLNRRWD